MTKLFFAAAILLIMVPARADLVLAGAPRDANDSEMYQPIADFLTKVTGETVRVAHTVNFLLFEEGILKDKYDFVFAGPHFNSWQISNEGHTALVRLPQKQVWAIIVGVGEDKITNTKDLAGYSVCAHAPPNLGTLILLSQFPNPVRQPYIKETKGWKKIYDAIASGACKGGILPLTQLHEYDGAAHRVKTIFLTAPTVNQALTASKRISPELQGKIRQALLSDNGQRVMTRLRAAYSNGKPLVAADNAEYSGMDVMLLNERGFEPK